MAGGFHLIWISLLFTCALCTSDPRDVQESLVSFVRTGNPEVDKILSSIRIPDDVAKGPVNVTSIVIKTCTGMAETLEELQRRLQRANQRYNQLDDEAFGLRTQVIQLKGELATCMSTAASKFGSYQTHLQLKMKQMLGKLDGDTLLIFNIMTLTREVSTLQEKIKLATNSNRTANEITELQKELDKKTAELKDKIQQAEESLSNATLILQIISLQNQIWALQEAETRGEKPNSKQSSSDMTLVKQQLNRKITLLQEKGDGNVANLLELIYVRTRIAELNRMISDAIEKSKTFAADARKQWNQKIDLLRKLIIQLKDDENNKELTVEIMRVQAEVQHFAQLMKNAKNITNSQIQELRAMLDREKQKQDVLQRQLEAVEYVKAQQIVQIISLIEEMKEQQLIGQPTTVRDGKEKEYAEAQAKIRELERKLRLKTEMDSKFVKRYEQVKIDFDRKIAELNRTEAFQPALIIKLMSVHDELKALKDQISLSEDKNLTSALRRQLERKQEELSSGIADIESLTSSPGAILKILELQHELWNLRNKATSGTTSDREAELQNRLDGFINEINNRAGENTKLILKIRSLQSQVEHLETLLSQTYNSNSPNMAIIRNNLTDELTIKRVELQRYINELNNKNPANARLTLVITELYKNLKRIEKENRDDNAASSLTLTLHQMYLQNKNREYALIKDKVAELERKLQLKTHECSGLEQQRDRLKTEVEDKIAELNKTKDFKTALILNVINLQAEARALKEKISNSKDPEIISQLQMQLEKKQDELISKTAEMEKLIANPTTVLQIIEIQDDIWDLLKKDVNGTAGDQIKALQNRIDTLMGQMGSRDQENTKLTLKILNLQSQVKHLQKLLSNRETLQTSKLTELTNELAAKKGELEKHVNEMKEKNQENANLILNITDLQSQLENLEKVKTAEDEKSAATISNLKKQLKVKEAEHSRDQEVILDLQQKLNETESCSDYEEKITELQENLTDKIKQLQSKSNSVTSLALQISTLSQQVEQLKAQIKNSVSKAKVDELQKAIDEKNEELDKLTKELKERSTQPRRLLQIIALQTEIEKLDTVAKNDTDDEKVKALQERLNYLIAGIKDEQNENTKLTFQILNQQTEIARLKKEEARKNQTQEAKIKDLEGQLEVIRNQINTASAAQITELQMQIKELEDLISTLKEAHTENLADLQRRLNLKERQLEDTENQLEHADAENYKYVMEIADLRAKLKTAVTQTSEKKIKDIEKKLKTQETENKKLEAANKELERKLQLKTRECSGLEQQRDRLKTEVEEKIAELNKTKDFKTALILNVINLQAEVRALKEQMLNSKDPETISQLQMQLEKKQDELITKTAEMEKLVPNPTTVLQIIEIQDDIWDLLKKDVNGTAGDQIKALQNRIDTLMGQMGSRDQENTKLTLKILNLQSQVKHLQKLLSNRETLQTSKLTELTNELAAKKGELEKHVNEMKEKNQENANLILNITDLQSQLENLEKVKTAEDEKSAATISNLKKQLKVKEVEHSRDQEVILDLQQKLNETESCSDYEEKITELQENLNDKIKKLQSKSNSVTSLALQISTLSQQVEQLKAQIKNSVSKAKVDELQKAIDEKNEELDKLTKELKERSTQPQRLLQIIALQTEIEKLVLVGQNDTDDEKVKALQERLNSLIAGIKDEQNENTKLTFQILNQQDEIARLKKLNLRKNQTQEAKIKDLEGQLGVIRNEIKHKTDLLGRRDISIANLSAQIMDLHKQIKPLEDKMSALKEAHTENLADLQRRLNLKERQLEDTESQLEHADAENYKYVMEIADLRAKLKTAVTQTSGKTIKDMEKKLKTQETENKKLEVANKDLKQEVTELKTCCSQLPDDCEDLQRELQQSHEDADRLQEELHQKDAKLNQLEQELQRQTRENNKLQNNIDRLQRELGDVEEKTIHTSKMTFDPDTAHPRIVLSDDETEMTTTDFLQNVPNNPSRFDVTLGILGATGFSSGRHYWEVSVAGKTCYHLGMTSESSRRKGSISFSPTNGYWTIVLDKLGQYRAIEHRRSVQIATETHPVTLGILLDYKKGTISFYDSGARTHMYSFVGQHFTGKIYPFVNFCVEDGSAPNPVVLITPGATDWIK